MKSSLKTLLNYVAISIMFTGAFIYGNTFFGQARVFYLIMAVVFLLWLPALNGIYFNKGFLVLFSIIVLSSFFSVARGDNTMLLLTKQIIGIASNAIFFYLLLKINDYDVKRLFKIYLNIAFFIAVIGLFQEVSFLLKFRPGYDYSSILYVWKTIPVLARGGLFIRVNSILIEPAEFCHAIIPAFFVSLLSFTRENFKFLSKWKSLTIILAYLFTFSTVGYIGIFFSLVILLCNRYRLRGAVFSLLLVSLFFIAIYSTVDEFSLRMDGVIKIIKGYQPFELVANVSVFALYTNALVAYNSFMDNPLIGSGLGSHAVSYFRYIGEIVDLDTLTHFINFNDAASLFLRLMSETGLLGLLILFVFIFRFHITKGEDGTGYLWIINNAVLCTIFSRLLRAGHYFYIGAFFFFWVYYFSKIRLRAIRAESG